MPIIQYRPTSPARRFQSGFTFSEITKDRPESALTTPLKKSGGRGNTGRVTIRFRGGGHKRLYRVIDFKRDKLGVPATVVAIEYDPNRSARIALLHYASRPGRRRTSSRAAASSSRASRSAPWCTTSSCARAVAGSSAEAPARRSS